jgi:hypothetical protein
MTVRAMRQLSKAEALAQFRQNPELASNRGRSARRQHLARHLHVCGPRPVLEALLAIEGGQSLDTVLEEFGRLPAELFEAIGADRLPMDGLLIISRRVA